jgi:DNA-binding NtrC family response regulator
LNYDPANFFLSAGLSDSDNWFSNAGTRSPSSYVGLEDSITPSPRAAVSAMFDAFDLSKYPILIVDDNEGICILIMRMLSNIGFRNIFIANSAKQAYSIFSQLAEQEHDPIIFLDLRLPDVPGEKVAKKIMEIRPSSKIILVTAEDSTAESSQEAMRQGAAAFIQKPIGLQKIRSVLLSILKDMEAQQASNVEAKGSFGTG